MKFPHDNMIPPAAQEPVASPFATTGASWVALGSGHVKMVPAVYNGLQLLVLRNMQHPRRIGDLEPVEETFTPQAGDTVISFGNVEAAKALISRIEACIEAMNEALAVERKV